MRHGWTAAAAGALVLTVAGAAAAALARHGGGASAEAVAEEAIRDHLRVLASTHPVAFATAEPNAAAAWLREHLDFAPPVPAQAGSGLVLDGPAVGYVFDRKAAVLVHHLRLHQVTLLEFPAAGLLDGGDAEPLPPLDRRGYHAVVWHRGAVGFALVSDSDAAELRRIARTLAAAPLVAARP